MLLTHKLHAYSRRKIVRSQLQERVRLFIGPTSTYMVYGIHGKEISEASPRWLVVWPSPQDLWRIGGALGCGREGRDPVAGDDRVALPLRLQ